MSLSTALALLELAALAYASYQDIKTREIDAWIIAAMYAPALAAAYLSWGKPLYIMSPILGAVLALIMRITGSGYADSLTILATSFFPPPLPYLPTPVIVVMGSSPSIFATVLWLFLSNKGRPCKMTLAERFTHACITREEALKNKHKYIIGQAKDLEKYKAPEDVEGEYVVAKYGLPYVAHMALGFAVYALLLIARGF